MSRLTCPRWIAVYLAILIALCAVAANAHDLQPPDYRGDPLSAYFHWLPANPDVPGSGVLPFPEYWWVDDNDPDTFFLEHIVPQLTTESGTNGQYLTLELPNFFDELPLKLMRVQLTWTGSSLTPPTIADILGFSGPTGVSSGQVDYSSPISPYTQPDGGYQYHDLSIRPNPDWEMLTIHVPQGVVIDQIVVDTISTIPEPSSLVLVVLGAAAGFVALSRRRTSWGRSLIPKVSVARNRSVADTRGIDVHTDNPPATVVCR